MTACAPPRNWSAYTAGQVNEGRLFDTLLRDLVESVEEPEQHLGRPRIPLRDALFCAVKKVHTQLSCRRAQTQIRHAGEAGHVSRVPNYAISSRLLNREDVRPILLDLIRASALPLASIERRFAIDSSGFRTTGFYAYRAARYGDLKGHEWLKAHICVGTSTRIVTNVVVTEQNGADSLNFEALVRGTAAAGFRMEEVAADKAYSARKNFDAVQDVGGKAFIPFRKGATGTSMGSPAWRKAFHYFQLHREEFEEHYHRRSNVESVFSAIKRKFGDGLKSKNRVAQENELLCKILAYNITVLIQEVASARIPESVLVRDRGPTPPRGEGHVVVAAARAEDVVIEEDDEVEGFTLEVALSDGAALELLRRDVVRLAPGSVPGHVERDRAVARRRLVLKIE